MADTSNRGLGSDKMDDQTKHDIQSEGGQASHNGGNSGMKGGQATQQGSEQSGRDNSGQFEEGSQEASEAGKMGGSNS